MTEVHRQCTNTTRGLLENNVDITVVAINPSRNYVDVNSLSDAYREATKFQSVYIDTRIRPLQILLNFFKKDSYFIERFRSDDFEQKLKTVLSGNTFDVIQLEHLYLFLYLNVIRKHSKAKVIFRPQNVEFVIWKRYLNHLRNPFKRFFIKTATGRLERFEKEASGKADGIIALTKDDADLFRTFVKDIPVVDIPMGFDFANLKDYDFEEQYRNFPVFYHLGSMDWLPNEEAIRWFVDEVLDLVVAQIPDVRIHIAGRNMQNYFFQKQSNNLIVEGEITDPIRYQQDKAIMIVPLLSGSGIRAKIVEGLALGKTIITTTIGAQGIRYEENKHLIIADSPQEFAAKMLACSQSVNYCRSIGKQALELSDSTYHYISIAKDLMNFYAKTESKK